MVAVLLIALAVAACTAKEDDSRLTAIEEQPATANVLYVTPTSVPTLVPTAVRLVATASPTAALALSPTASAASSSAVAVCDAELEQLYAHASDLCLTAPSGYFCNGGLAPEVAPSGAAANALSAPGGLVEATKIDSLQTAPPAVNSSGGLVWLRLEEDILMDALLIGGIRISSSLPAASNSAKWQSFTIESRAVASPCAEIPETGVLVAQGLYGQSPRVAINGVSAEINGTIVVLTQANITKFMAIEGQIRLISSGRLVTLNAGEQLDVSYPAGDWTAPDGLPDEPILLEYELISHLPIVLFDRPVVIPQPGFVQTQGRVNMRAGPDINSRLLFQVPAGETMSVLGISTNGEWLHIRLGNGETGWMSAPLLVQNIGTIQQVYDATPLPPQRYGELASRARVNVSDGGNLREAPDVAFRVKRTIPFGEELKLLARSPYSPWVKVDAGGDIGWMALFTLQTKSVIGSLPIDYQVPLPPRPTSTPSFSYGGGHAYPNPSGGF